MSLPGDADAAVIRALLRQAMPATLGTIDAETGHPYASLVQMATRSNAEPLLLISSLARHTRNLHADPRVSLLADSRTLPGDPLTLPRATLLGHASENAHPQDLARFVGRHPEAASYAGFSDFGLWRLTIESAHLVAGFGRIKTVPGARIVLPARLVDLLAERELDLVRALNAEFFAADTRGDEHAGPDGVVSLDPEGLDVRVAGIVHRLSFGQMHIQVNSFHAAARALVTNFLNRQARFRQGV